MATDDATEAAGDAIDRCFDDLAEHVGVPPGGRRAECEAGIRRALSRLVQAVREECGEDTKRLDWMAAHVGNVDFHVHPVRGVWMSNPFIAKGANLRGCIDQVSADLALAMRDQP